jgi:SWI/SNF-related matrix-associated actin-dependent regulator of chromatin subfamily A protein 2/4
MAQLESLDLISKAKSLISALNLVSRDLPLPPDLFDVVSSIYDTAHDANPDDAQGLVWFLTNPPSFFCVLSFGFRF